MNLSKTNTDTLCHDEGSKAAPIQKAFYRYNLITAMYMLEPSERWALNILFVILAALGFLYTYVFWKGFMDGWRLDYNM